MDALNLFLPSCDSNGIEPLTAPQIASALASGISFTLETTLSGEYPKSLCRKAKAAGYLICLYYVLCWAEYTGGHQAHSKPHRTRRPKHAGKSDGGRFSIDLPLIFSRRKSAFCTNRAHKLCVSSQGFFSFCIPSRFSGISELYKLFTCFIIYFLFFTMFNCLLYSQNFPGVS